MPHTLHSFLTPTPLHNTPQRVLSEVTGRINVVSEEKQEAPKRPFGGPRNPDDVIEQRCRRLYIRQLDGLSARALVYQHAEREGVSIATAWRDWKTVNNWSDEDWKRDRENMLPRLQHMRTKLFNQALKKGQLQTAAQVLDSIGRVIGESTETINIQAPDLKIQIEDKD